MSQQRNDSLRQQLADFFNISSGCRFSIGALILLLMIVPVSRFALPLLMENGLLIDNFSQAILASFAWYVTTALLILQVRIALAHGPERFTWWNQISGEPSEREPRELNDLMEASRRRGAGWPGWLWLLWIFLPMPALTMVADLNLRVNTAVITAEELYSGFIVGGLIATVVLLLLSFLRKYILPGVVPLRGIFPFECLLHQQDNLLNDPNEVANLPKGIAVMLARIGMVRGPGYSIKDPNGVERPLAGHLELALLLLLLLVMTFALGIFDHVIFPGSNLAKVIPTLGHFALVVAILSTFASGMAFWLDRFRVSTLLAASAFALALFLSRDYEFQVEMARWQSPTLVEAIEAKKIPASRSNDPRQHDQRTLIVVTAPGGGIHAAAWSAEVLTRLDERWPDTFRQSLGMISSVSGGSVGSMYYMDAISSPQIEVTMEEVRERAKLSCLEPIFFAATFHDLLPLTPYDRGTAIERFWDFTLRSGERGSPSLSDWGIQAQSGQMPVMVFNATDVKSGRRVLLASTSIRDDSQETHSHGMVCNTHTCAFDLRQNDLDMNVATAVRLSASFPYVTPISRPVHGEGGKQVMPPVRIGDGAYADNDGIMTALESVSQLIDRFSTLPPSQRPFDRILLINIDNYGTSAGHPEIEGSGGQVEALSYATIGPLLGLSNVRGASQAERGRLEVGLLQDRTLTEQEVMWVIRQMSRRGDRRGPRDQDPPEFASNSSISMQAQRSAWQRMSRFSEAPLTTPTSSQHTGAMPGDHADHHETFGSQRGKGPALYPIQFKVVSIPYRGDSDPPLSWKLSSDQMRTYSEAWQLLDDEASAWTVSTDQDWDDLEVVPPLKVIEQWLGPPGKEAANWTIAGRPAASQVR
ncbi:Patatin-like phospholipase [Bremerella volcania]|uniref:Patatin-like phospholipase n=1 Tax=Bremerella volcania TaxID=2527984 RepID=A0A518C653_9BACT|nr:patatin-like phospholipase family protein [Bremerella volcania]QDU74697.1 Patatin-like phospholipase [Bremerella volcania]